MLIQPFHNSIILQGFVKFIGMVLQVACVPHNHLKEDFLVL
jgi:hypothetical protein